MGEVEIIYHGHAMFEIRSGDNIKIVLDPYNEEIKTVLPDVSGDIVLVSHDHYDHSNVSIIKGNPLIVNKVMEDKNIKGINIEGIQTYHDTQKGQMRGNNIIFKFIVDEIVFVHMGDLGHDINFEVTQKLKNVDILMIPVGGLYTIDASMATKIINKLAPSLVIPMHYKEADSKLEVDKIDSFLKKWPGYKKVGHLAKVSKADLLFREKEVWVFDSK